MVSGEKVIIDASVLIAASLNHTSRELGGKLIQDHFYKISNPLFNYFKKNIDKEIGIVTLDIENSARAKIISALIRKISQLTHVSRNQLSTHLNDYSETLMYITNSLLENMNLLTRVPVDETEISRLALKIHSFYENLKIKLRKKNPKRRIDKRAEEGFPGLKGYFRQFAKEDEKENLVVYKKLLKKLNNNPPDINDCRILAQAIYLSKRREAFIFIASTDYHFSKVKLDADDALNTFIPDSIMREFDIKCDWPDNILKILMKDSRFLLI